MQPNDFKPPGDINWFMACLWIVLGGYAGLMAYLMRSVNDGGRPKFWRAVLELGAAVSSGTTVMLLCSALGWSSLWTGVVVSASGWLGPTSIMRIVQAIALKRMGLTQADLPPEKQ